MAFELFKKPFALGSLSKRSVLLASESYDKFRKQFFLISALALSRLYSYILKFLLIFHQSQAKEGKKTERKEKRKAGKKNAKIRKPH